MSSQRGGKALQPLALLAWLESNRRFFSLISFSGMPLPLPTQLPQLSHGVPRNGAKSLASFGSSLCVCAPAFFSLPPTPHHPLPSPKTFKEAPPGAVSGHQK